MAFSQGFNNTFRSLDGAFQWRAQQDEAARQYDETLSENKRQFNETAAQANEVNQSQIKLRDTQTRELETVISNLQQEMGFARDKHPLALEGMEAQNNLVKQRTALTGQQTRGAQLTNQYNARTLDSRTRATNAGHRQQEYDANRAVFSAQNEEAQNLDWALRDENGRQLTAEEIVMRPDKLAAFSGLITRASEVTDVDFGLGENDYATAYPVDSGDPSQGYHILRSVGGKPGLEPVTGEDGQPLIISAEEMVGYVDGAMQDIDQQASLAGGGSARDNQVQAQAGELARQQAGPAPTNPGPAPDVNPDEIQAEIEDLEAQQAEVERRLGELPLANARQRNPNVSLDNVAPRVREQLQEYDRLAAQQEELTRRLGDLRPAFESSQRQQGLVDRYQQDSQRYTRTLGALTDRNTTRALRPEAMDRQVAGAEATTNRMTTGRGDVSAEEAQADRNEQIEDGEKLIRDKLSYVVTSDKNGQRKTVKDPVMGNRLANQFRSLVNNPDTREEWNYALDSGMVPTVVQSAIDLAGGDPDRVSLQAGLTMLRENVAAQDAGAVMDYVSRQVADEGGIMTPEQYKQYANRVTQVLSERESNGRVTDDEAKSLAALALNPQRSQRTLGE